METFKKSENLDNIIDFKKAGEAVRKVKPAKTHPQPGKFTEFFSLEKNLQIKDLKDLERQSKELEERIKDLEKIAEKLEIDYNLAIAEKDRGERVGRGSVIFDNLHRVNTEISYLRGLSEEIKYKMRELKSE